jgi:hypothetical protein
VLADVGGGPPIKLPPSCEKRNGLLPVLARQAHSDDFVGPVGLIQHLQEVAGLAAAGSPTMAISSAGERLTVPAQLLKEELGIADRDSSVSLLVQNASPPCESCDRMSSLGNHTEIPQKGRIKGCHMENPAMETNGSVQARGKAVITEEHNSK